MPFLGAQAFFVNPGSVGNAPEVGLSGVDLFFKQKPNANNNASGVTLPSVAVSVVPCVNGIPDLTQQLTAPSVRVGYTDIQVDPHANSATRFEFYPPVQVVTNTYFAFVVCADDPNYLLWGDQVGQAILGSNVISTGPSGPYTGNFFDFVGPVPSTSSNGGSLLSGGNTSIYIPPTNQSSNTGMPSTATILGSWTPRAGFDLKFTVYAARYSFGGNTALSGFTQNGYPANAQITFPTNAVVNATSGETIFAAPAGRYEYISYATGNSSNVGVLVGERVFQNTVFYPGGKGTPVQVSVAQGSNTLVLVNTAALNWSSLLQVGGVDPEYIVVTSGNALGANASVVNVRLVTGLISNSVITVDEPWTFTNNQAFFFRSPVCKVDQWLSGRIFGVHSDLMVLAGATANTTMRFVNDSILDVQVNTAAIGNGYSNTDYLEVTGFESVAGKVIGGYKANAQINTFSNSAIESVWMANLGAGFTNASAITITVYAANGVSSNGSNAAFIANVGSTVQAEFMGQTGGGGYFTQTKVINIEIGNEVPGPGINNPATTQYHATEYLPYYSVDDANVVLGRVYYCDSAGSADIIPIQFNTTVYPWSYTKRRAVMSWSNELITPFANGRSSAGGGGFTDGAIQPGLSNSSVVYVNAISNSDFGSITFAPKWSTITFSRFIINNDYTGENTDQGNAWAKGIEVSFNLANAQLAEDVVVYSTCYRPQVTNVVMFTRLYNSSDPDQFHDKDWSMLQINFGGEVFTPSTDPTTKQELTWGLRAYPNTTTLAGLVTVTSGCTHVTGLGTTFSSNLVVGDLVRIYQPLFSNTDYFISTVETITNNTAIVLGTATANADVLGSGLAIDKILYKKQAFINPQNNNVVRYYNSQNVPFDGYDTAQIKAVMVSSNGVVVPMLSDVRMIAVSA